MIDLELWEKDLKAGLERMRQEAAELAVRIHRQEGALMLTQELQRQESQAPEPVIAEVEPVA
jgi:hypothetical protein